MNLLSFFKGLKRHASYTKLDTEEAYNTGYGKGFEEGEDIGLRKGFKLGVAWESMNHGGKGVVLEGMAGRQVNEILRDKEF